MILMPAYFYWTEQDASFLVLQITCRVVQPYSHVPWLSTFMAGLLCTEYLLTFKFLPWTTLCTLMNMNILPDSIAGWQWRIQGG